jgi:hypothetical protein
MSITAISTYLKAHERLVLVAIVGLVLWFAIGKVDTLIAHHDAANLQQAQATLQTQQSKDAALATQATQQAAQYQALAEKVDAENVQLVQANATLSAALAKQQHTDASLPLPELANRWTALVPEAKPTATATGLAVDTTGAVATVQQLESVPVLTSELSNAKGQLANVDSLLTASTGQVATLNEEVSGLRLENTDEAKVCTAQIAVVKAQAAKSKRRWFLVGLVAGFLGRGAL